MAIPKDIPMFDDKWIPKAIEYIDKNGILHKSRRYDLIWENGKRYPPKDVIAIAAWLGNGRKFTPADYNWYHGNNAAKYFKEKGYEIYDKKEDIYLGGSDEEQRENSEMNYINKYSEMLLQSKNIIFRGAPGTGRTYLAKRIAADIVSDGETDDYSRLTDEQKEQIAFVQFHPNYDYSDFIEGLRPVMNDDGSLGFQLQDGIFKSFVDNARRNYEDSQKSPETIEKESTAKAAMERFLDEIDFENNTYDTITGNKFSITNVDDRHIYISIPGNSQVNKLALNIEEIQRMLEAPKEFKKVKDITRFFGKQFAKQEYSYDFVLYNEIKSHEDFDSIVDVTGVEQKRYVFIIDEINRGEISKILGELFFTIDPGYRGKAGEVYTQYSNMHVNTNDKFYIPENVYIIGTMNDINRSVDTFDFAMRRRFRFIEITPDDTIDMLDVLDDSYKNEIIERMTELNKAIVSSQDLNENYQIGAAYFLKLKDLDYDFDVLWSDFLCPLLHDYVSGIGDENDYMEQFEEVYNLGARGEVDGALEDEDMDEEVEDDYDDYDEDTED